MATQIRYVTEDDLPGHPEHQVQDQSVQVAFVEDGAGYKELRRVSPNVATLWKVDDRDPTELLKDEDWSLADFPNKDRARDLLP